MAEKAKIVLTKEQTVRMNEARDIIDGAIQAHCTCSASKLASERIGLSFGRGRIKNRETVCSIAGRFALCDGVANNMCHYPPDVPNESAIRRLKRSKIGKWLKLVTSNLGK